MIILMSGNKDIVIVKKLFYYIQNVEIICRNIIENYYQ